MNANRMTFAAATAAALLGSWGTAPKPTITPIYTIETEGPPTNGYFLRIFPVPVAASASL